MTPTKLFTLARGAAAVALALAAGLPAGAQSTTRAATGSTSDAYSLLPYTRSGYIGLNLGKPEWNSGCASGFSCNDANLSGYIYTGGLINEMLGAEVGYLHTGNADRNGGSTRARGVNLSLVARVPLGAFNVFAKAGVLYGETRVSASALSGAATGKKRGWGGAYAAGVGLDLTPQTGVVLEWARNDFQFAGGRGRDDIDSLSLGLVHRF